MPASRWDRDATQAPHGAARATGRGKRPRSGQVVVEVLLVLPVFLWLVFTIMEIGHLAFRAILLHHAAYEVARYGALTCVNTKWPSRSCEEPQPDEQKMKGVAEKILPKIRMDVRLVQTVFDNQANCQAYDLVVTLQQDVPMVFPMTGVWLAYPRGGRTRRIAAAVPMPVERPLFH